LSRFVVVGDALLDRDLVGEVERLSPEAPVPVVDELARTTRPGGAALAAVLAARDGVDVTLVTALADDVAGRELAELLWDADVELIDLRLNGRTPLKVRVFGAGRLLLRLDHGDRRPGVVGPLTPDGRLALLSADAVLVSDYGRGVARSTDVLSAVREAALTKAVVWDPHEKGGNPAPGVRMITPNRSEAVAFTADIDGEGLQTTARRARVLRERWRSHSVCITLGAEGALLAGPRGLPLLVPAEPLPFGDPCGAGDRFAVSAAAALAEGALIEQAVEQAVSDATGYVAAGGASSLSVSSPAPTEGTNEADEAEALVARIRRGGGTVVATGGCFDILHAGHVAMLEAARALGDCLVVLVNSDDSVRRLKGPGRPLVPEEDRVAVLRGLGAVDSVLVFEEDTPEAALARLRPDIFAKGADYSLDELPEAAVMERWGGQALLLPYVDGRSTTRLIQEAQLHGST
jgi:D-beta-D-heptose 7-phosphate kinase / D-beta-D-heptose 1-phosphate adenosyltransferase